jgi:hypothetical protein
LTRSPAILAFVLATPVGAQVLPGASRDFGPIAVSAGYADSGRAITFDTSVRVDWDRAVPAALRSENPVAPADSAVRALLTCTDNELGRCENADVNFAVGDARALSTWHYYLVSAAGVSRLRFDRLVGTLTFAPNATRDSVRPVGPATGRAIARVLDSIDAVPGGFVLSARGPLVVWTSMDTLNAHEIAAAIERARTDTAIHSDLTPTMSWEVVHQYAFIVDAHHRCLLLDAGPPVRVLAVNESSCDT